MVHTRDFLVSYFRGCEMKYYLHDSNSFNDEKITELFINFGYEGLGLFYTLLEKLAQQEKPIKTEVLKHQLKVGKKLNKCWMFMEDIDIISSNNGETFNKQLLNFSEKYQIKKEKNAKRISEWRENQLNTKNVTHYESVGNTSKVNRSKVNRNKVKESEYSFDDFWNLYNKKIDRYKCLSKWNKIKDIDKSKILKHIPEYLKSQPETKYRKNPLTYLNGQCWNDEIMKNTAIDEKYYIDNDGIKQRKLSS